MGDQLVDNARPWALDFDSHEGEQRPVAAELEKFLGFAQTHEKRLLELRAAVTDDHVVNAPRYRGARAVRADARPPERAPAFELCVTGERGLRKAGARAERRVPGASARAEGQPLVAGKEGFGQP